jgi:outer membrane protein OmpA-like peptidoglycan-associated protein
LRFSYRFDETGLKRTLLKGLELFMSRLLTLLIGLLAAAILAFFCIRSHIDKIPYDIEGRLTAAMSSNQVKTVPSFDIKDQVNPEVNQIVAGDDAEASPVLTIINGRDVTLRGLVKDAAEKIRIGNLAKQIEGVRVVYNELTTPEEAKAEIKTEEAKIEAPAQALVVPALEPVKTEEPKAEIAEAASAEIQPVASLASNPYFTSTDDTAKRCAADVANVIGADQTVQFASSSARLTPAGKALVRKIAEAIKACPKMIVNVIGHTDNSGSEVLNKRLSVLRARAVTAQLNKYGIAWADLRAEGLGSSRPIADNIDYAGRTKNRRIEFQLTTAVTAN